MPALQKFYQFVQDLATKKHNLGTDQLKVALCNAANPPDVAADAVLVDLVEIAYTYLSSRNITTTSCLQSAGLLSLILADLTLTASGGSVAAFRYVVIYNDTAASDNLICFFDLGSEITLASGQNLFCDFSGVGTLFTIQ